MRFGKFYESKMKRSLTAPNLFGNRGEAPAYSTQKRVLFCKTPPRFPTTSINISTLYVQYPYAISVRESALMARFILRRRSKLSPAMVITASPLPRAITRFDIALTGVPVFTVVVYDNLNG